MRQIVWSIRVPSALLILGVALALVALTVHLQGALAVVTGQYSQKGTSGGKDISAAGIYANTWVKRNGRWLVVHSVFP